jgi:hypothetical protein
MIKCSNCLYKVFNITNGESYCGKGNFEDVNIRENIKAMNCNDYFEAFILVGEVENIEIKYDELPF